MNDRQRTLRVRGKLIEFCLGVILLSTFAIPDRVAAQNTKYGTGALAHNTTGTDNSAFGYYALWSNTTGEENTAMGWSSLLYNAGDGNTAVGSGALAQNQTGSANTAVGNQALYGSFAGFSNTATGFQALFSDSNGNYNTADGDGALGGNTFGNNNTATGSSALSGNTNGNYNTADGANALVGNGSIYNPGSYNTASGANALSRNTTGNTNTASGSSALFSNVGGTGNTASGYSALLSNIVGNYNTASGYLALNRSKGSSNIGVGFKAGSNIVAGSNNIEIGSAGPTDESNTIRIGNNTIQKSTYIAGISATRVTGSVVEVTSSGQLGIPVSSARYKRDIHNIGNASDDLMRLRPVMFRYKDDPSGTLQYGLVAEEVARVYPELVIRDTGGKLMSVRYLEFTALLLNELQKQAMRTERLAQLAEKKDRQIAAQQREIDALKQNDGRIGDLTDRLAALARQPQTGSSERHRSLARK